MLLGLVFREGAKTKRSINHYHSAPSSTSKGVLPVFVNASPAFSNTNTGSSAFSTPKSAPAADFGSWKSSADSLGYNTGNEKAGYGFGRQGEKAAGLRGFMLQKPEEALPRYASPSPAPSTRSASRSASPAPSISDTRYSSHSQFPSRPSAPTPRQSRLLRNKSTTSSFVSPGAWKLERAQRLRQQQEEPMPSREPHYIQDEDNDDESMYAEERTETPPPTFKSSPTAI